MKQENLDKIIAFRHVLHEHPELSNHEVHTRKLIKEFIAQNMSKYLVLDEKANGACTETVSDCAALLRHPLDATMTLAPKHSLKPLPLSDRLLLISLLCATAGAAI